MTPVGKVDHQEVEYYISSIVSNDRIKLFFDLIVPFRPFRTLNSLLK